MVIGAGLVSAGTFAWAFISRRQNLAAVFPAKPIVAQRAFFVEGSTPGTLVLRDVDSNAVIKTYTPDQDGFIRTTLKGLERARRSAEMDLRAPYQLTKFNDGMLTLDDIATGQRIELIAFGPTNLEAFAELLGTSKGAR